MTIICDYERCSTAICCQSLWMGYLVMTGVANKTVSYFQGDWNIWEQQVIDDFRTATKAPTYPIPKATRWVTIMVGTTM